MLLLGIARALIAAAPFRLWQSSLGALPPASARPAGPEERRLAWLLAAHVRRAAQRLPFAAKCLPRAMALAWLLRARRLPYVLRLAVRPDGARIGEDRLHAWVECGDEIVIGELDGPWIVTFSLAG